MWYDVAVALDAPTWTVVLPQGTDEAPSSHVPTIISQKKKSQVLYPSSMLARAN
jgi:hypothetical protein